MIPILVIFPMKFVHKKPELNLDDILRISAIQNTLIVKRYNGTIQTLHFSFYFLKLCAIPP